MRESIRLVQGKGKGGSLAGDTFYKCLLVMGLQDVLYDGQTQPRAPVFARPALVHAIEALKDPGQFLFIDAYAIVFDFDQDPVC
jgi:hypothetical protein